MYEIKSALSLQDSPHDKPAGSIVRSASSSASPRQVSFAIHVRNSHRLDAVRYLPEVEELMHTELNAEAMAGRKPANSEYMKRT